MRWPIPSLLKAAVSVSILVLVLSRISIDDLVARAKGGAAIHLAAALLLVLVMVVLVTLRWRLLTSWLGLVVPVRLAVRAVFVGLFGGQLLPSVVGTDLLRGWVVARHTGETQRVAASLVADRLVALFAACLLLALSYGWLSQLPVPYAALLAPAALLLSGAGLLAFVLACSGVLQRALGLRLGFLRSLNTDAVILQPQPILAAIVVAVAIQAIAVIAAALTAEAYGIDASLEIWLSIIPLSVIACAVPISINGWGVRETVIVTLAAQHGLSQVDALLVSLTLGALNIIASLPGAYLLLHRARHRA
jgi:uncharacterized membrane protein YbhN (UPF0104 family)